ncbi:hypothetical protein D3C77_447670 [compost metagenome]
MRLIHEQSGMPLLLGKLPFQRNPRIKNIIIVTNDRIGGISGIQRKFERTDTMLASVRLDDAAVNQSLVAKHIQNSSVHPVIVAVRVNAVFFPAAELLLKANLLLRGNGHRMKMQSLGLQARKGLLCRSPRNRLGRKIEDALQQPCANRFDRREYRRHRLADSRRRLGKQLDLLGNTCIYRTRKFPLSLAIRGKRKC